MADQASSASARMFTESKGDCQYSAAFVKSLNLDVKDKFIKRSKVCVGDIWYYCCIELLHSSSQPFDRRDHAFFDQIYVSIPAKRIVVHPSHDFLPLSKIKVRISHSHSDITKFLQFTSFRCGCKRNPHLNGCS